MRWGGVIRIVGEFVVCVVCLVWFGLVLGMVIDAFVICDM